MPKEPTKPRWSVERRLEFIEFRLFWEGRLNRSDLTDFFGVSVPQASADLTRYQQVAEGNMVYDKGAKAYVAGTDFRPIYFTPSADRYLAELRLLQADLFSAEETWVPRTPAYAIVEPPRRRLDAATLRFVLEAIRNRSSIEVRYQSFSQPEPVWRRFAPHALAFDGLRWHIRAWCHNRFAFRDFVIGRILAFRGAQPDSIDPSEDIGWNTLVTLRIGPHPKLSGGRRLVTEIDYGMENGVLEVTARACIVPYLKLQLGLNRHSVEVEPSEQHIVLLNSDDVDRILIDCGVTVDLSPARKS